MKPKRQKTRAPKAKAPPTATSGESQAEAVARIEAAFGKPAPLCDELKRSIVTLDLTLADGKKTTLRAIHHPFCVVVHHDLDILNGTYNEALAVKQAEAAEAWAEKNWSSYIFLHERPYRPEALFRVRERGDLQPEVYWALAAHVWVDTEQEDDPIWHTLLKPNGRDDLLSARRSLMDATELHKLDSLTLGTQLYRGENRPMTFPQMLSVDKWSWSTNHLAVIPPGDRRWSWTTNPDVARHFAGKAGTVLTMRIGDLAGPPIACFDSRGEDEVLVDPHTLPKRFRR